MAKKSDVNEFCKDCRHMCKQLKMAKIVACYKTREKKVKKNIFKK